MILPYSVVRRKPKQISVNTFSHTSIHVQLTRRILHQHVAIVVVRYDGRIELHRHVHDEAIVVADRTLAGQILARRQHDLALLLQLLQQHRIGGHALLEPHLRQHRLDDVTFALEELDADGQAAHGELMVGGVALDWCEKIDNYAM